MINKELTKHKFNIKGRSVVEVISDCITFDNGYKLYSEHESDCCESHYLSMSDLTLSDFDGLEFDLDNDDFFRRIPDYGIELIPIQGYSVRIPGYGYNNGYYSSQLDLCLEDVNGGIVRTYDVSECQVIGD